MPNNTTDSDTDSFNDRAKEAASAAEVKALRVRTVYTNYYSFSTLALSLPMFSVARRRRPKKDENDELVSPNERKLADLNYVDARWESRGRGCIVYRGPQLTQSHQTLLLNLLKSRSNSAINSPIFIKPRALLSLMGWSDSAGNRARLLTLINDLRTARAQVWWVHMLDNAEDMETTLITSPAPSLDKRGRWEIELGTSCIGLINGNEKKGEVTFLDVEIRKKLREGLVTFLYGYTFANTSNQLYPYKFRTLYKLSGATAKDMGQFSASVCAALDQLKEFGAIKSYERIRGAVIVRR
jgi:hypothetical protein